MTIKQVIQERINILPESRHAEILSFLDSLIESQIDSDTQQENQEWSRFSLEQAMIGLEDDLLPEYSEQDLKIKW
jgi:hypothetical protein